MEFTQDAQVAPVTANSTVSPLAPAFASVAALAAGSPGSPGSLTASCALLLQQDAAFFDAQQLPDSGSAMASAGYPASVTTRAASATSTPSGKATVCASRFTSTRSVLPANGSRALRIFFAHP